MMQLLSNVFSGDPTSAGTQADTKSAENLTGNEKLSSNKNDSQVRFASLLMHNSNRYLGIMNFVPLSYTHVHSEPGVSPRNYEVTCIWSLLLVWWNRYENTSSSRYRVSNKFQVRVGHGSM